MNRFAFSWEKLSLVGGVALVLVTALLVQGIVTTTAQTPPPTKHKTEATVDGVGVAPIINCKWELPDMIPGDNATMNP